MSDNGKDSLLKVPPIPCIFKAGDKVSFTNVNGVLFKDMVVIGFSEDPVSFKKFGRFIHVDFLPCSANRGAAWWAPHSLEGLKLG